MTPLVSTGWLKQHLKDPDVFVLDVRSAIDGGGVEAYQKGHIPGAIHSDYDKAGWRVTRGGVPFMLPTLAELEKLIGELGIDEDTHVVVVPAGVHHTDFGSAARTYWTLKVAGVSNVSILDGGYAAWAAEQNAIEAGPSKPSPKIFTATLNKALLAERTDVQKIEQSGGATLIDSRPASFFDGKQKAPAAKAYGHIPGAVNVDSATFYDAKTNRLKPQAELAVDRIGAAGRSGGHLLQHRALGRDRLVRALRIARPQRRAPLLRLDGRLDIGRRAARLPRRAPSGMT